MRNGNRAAMEMEMALATGKGTGTHTSSGTSTDQRESAPSRRTIRIVAALLSLVAAAPALAQPIGASPAIYSCVDAAGKRLTSDRPIVDCLTREQRVLNADGSVRRIVPPTPTAAERGVLEARERDAAVERASRQDAVRRDRHLLARFPNEALHRKARESALDDVHKGLQRSQSRLAVLAGERKPLKDETEFYAGKALPMKLKAQLDANDTAVEAQRTLMQNQRIEAGRIDQRYDAELERLRKLWAGAAPGSLGAPVGAAVPAGSQAAAARAGR